MSKTRTSIATIFFILALIMSGVPSMPVAHATQCCGGCSGGGMSTMPGMNSKTIPDSVHYECDCNFEEDHSGPERVPGSLSEVSHTRTISVAWLIPAAEVHSPGNRDARSHDLHDILDLIFPDPVFILNQSFRL